MSLKTFFSLPVTEVFGSHLSHVLTKKKKAVDFMSSSASNYLCWRANRLINQNKRFWCRIDRMTGIRSDWRGFCIGKTPPPMRLPCLELHFLKDLRGYKWNFLLVNNELWTKAFLKTNEREYSFMKTPATCVQGVNDVLMLKPPSSRNTILKPGSGQNHEKLQFWLSSVRNKHSTCSKVIFMLQKSWPIPGVYMSY